MRRKAVDDLEVGSELEGAFNAGYETLTLGFKGDETRALDRYIKEQDDIFFVPPKNYKETPEYQAILADERNKEREFAEDNPVADFTARLGGGVVTGGAVSRPLVLANRLLRVPLGRVVPVA